MIVSDLLSSIKCGRCKTSLSQEFKESGISKYKCQCGLKVRTVLRCQACHKFFLNFPYLIRKTNFCSLSCYWVDSNKKHIKKCQNCGKEFTIKYYLVDQGWGLYCSRNCWFRVFEKWKKQVKCKQCGKGFVVARSIYKRSPKYCSKNCSDKFKRDYVDRICRNCKIRFEFPRWELNKGKGSFCSWQCFKKFKGETSIERLVRLELQRLKEPFKQEAKFGRYHVDFLLSKRDLIIECDGFYWHRYKQKHDYKRDEFFLNKGYKVLRLTEETIRKDEFKPILNLLLSPELADHS